MAEPEPMPYVVCKELAESPLGYRGSDYGVYVSASRSRSQRTLSGSHCSLADRRHLAMSLGRPSATDHESIGKITPIAVNDCRAVENEEIVGLDSSIRRSATALLGSGTRCKVAV